MFRKHWRKPSFWRWWWRNRVPLEGRVAAGVAVLALLLAGGWLASGRLSRAEAKSDSGPFVLETTVERLITVREQGKLVKKLVPVVRRVLVQRTRTQFGTQMVTMPGQTRVVREPVVKYVPQVHERVVQVNGKTRTIMETRLVPVTSVQTRTQTNLVTNQQTVVDQRTVTERQTDVRTAVVTETAPPRTVTQTPPPETVTRTETETVTVTRTETLPPETVT